MKLTLIVYEIIMVVLFPFFMLSWLIKGMVRGREYLKYISERLSCIPHLSDHPKRIWIHAVSVGETKVSLMLVEHLNTICDDLTFHLTTTTPTARQLLRKSKIKNITYSYLPYDEYFIMKSTITRINPRILLMIESELWPNLLTIASSKTKCDLFLINAILSPKSLNRWKKLPWFARLILNTFSKILCRSPADKNRFLKMGVDNSKITTVGNLKYHFTVPKDIASPIPPTDRIIILAASTHFPEERAVIEAYRSLIKKHPNTLLIIVPRHPHRKAEIIKLLDTYEYNYSVRSNNQTIKKETNIYLADTIGELLGFYHIATAAFVGGSLSQNGGHNPIEAIMMGCPVITGPNVYNFMDEYKTLEQMGVITQVCNHIELVEKFMKIVENPTGQRKIVDESIAWLQGQNQALHQTTDTILHCLDNE